MSYPKIFSYKSVKIWNDIHQNSKPILSTKMIKATKLAFLLLSTLSILSCASNGDCTKTITIPGLVIQSPSGTAYLPDSQQVVPCDYEITPINEGVKLENFTYDVLLFEFTPDTGKKTSRLQYKIKLNNPNSFVAKGVPKLTIDYDGVVIGSYGVASEPFCTQIEAKSSCTIILDKEYPLNPDISLTKSVKLVTVEYILNF